MFLIIDALIAIPYILSFLIALFINRKELNSLKIKLARMALLFLAVPQMIIFTILILAPDYTHIRYALAAIALIIQIFLLWHLINILVYFKDKIYSYLKAAFDEKNDIL